MHRFLSRREADTWTALRSFAKGQPRFSRADLVAHGLPEETVRSFVKRWARQGWLEIVEKNGPTHVYAVTGTGASVSSGHTESARPDEHSFRSDKEANAWEAVRKISARRPFTVDDVAASGTAPTTADTYITSWLAAGLILMSGAHEGRPAYLPTGKVPEPEMREASPEGNMWRAMRILRTFSPTDIAAHSTAGGIEISVDRARSYCRQLLSARYLKCLKRAVPGRREPVYRLIEDTGPIPPRSTRMAGLLDENTGTFHPSRAGVST